MQSDLLLMVVCVPRFVPSALLLLHLYHQQDGPGPAQGFILLKAVSVKDSQTIVTGIDSL